MRRWIPASVAAICVAAWLPAFAVPLGARAQEASRFAGPKDGGFLLPNGWTLSPAGQHVPLSDLPLNIVPWPDNRHVLVATSGYNAHELSLIDLEQRKVVDRQAVRQSWFGLAVSPEGDRIWWSGGGGNPVHRVSPHQRSSDPHSGPRPGRRRGNEKRSGRTYGWRCAGPSRKVLYSLDVDRGRISPWTRTV